MPATTRLTAATSRRSARCQVTPGTAYSGRVKRTAWISRSRRAARRSIRLRPMKPVAPQISSFLTMMALVSGGSSGTVHRQDRPTDIRCRGRRQPQHRGRDLLGAAQALHRQAGRQGGEALRRMGSAAIDDAWAHRVDPDAVAGKLARQPDREGRQRTLRCSIAAESVASVGRGLSAAVYDTVAYVAGSGR